MLSLDWNESVFFHFGLNFTKFWPGQKVFHEKNNTYHELNISRLRINDGYIDHKVVPAL